MPAGDIGFYDPHKETRPLQTGRKKLHKYPCTPVIYRWTLFTLSWVSAAFLSVSILKDSIFVAVLVDECVLPVTASSSPVNLPAIPIPQIHVARPMSAEVVDQFFCLDTRLGIPCDDDVPFLINVLGFTLFYKNLDFVGEWCLSFKDLKIKHDGLVAPVPIPQSGDLVQQYKG
eukprot:gene29275-38344_t